MANLRAVGNELLLITRPRQHQEKVNVYKTSDITVMIYSVDLDPVSVA